MGTRRDKRPGSKHDWHWGHRLKKDYPTRCQALLHMVRRALLKQHWGLRPYKCSWGTQYEQGMTAETHWHLGHRPKWMGRPWLQRKIYYWPRKFIIWPFYRLRKCIRTWLRESRSKWT